MFIESVKLYPRSAFHLGERGIGLEETSLILHSDMLYSALCTAWVMLYGEKALSEELIPPKGDEESWQPPFLISSAFPFVGSVRFFPKPLLKHLTRKELMENEVEYAQEKKLKSINFVSESIFISLLSGDDNISFKSDKVLLNDDELLTSTKEMECLKEQFDVKSIDQVLFWSLMRVPRVSLDVCTGASNIWYFGRVNFNNEKTEKSMGKTGYHFLVSYLNEHIKGRFQSAVRLLGDIGIGGDRSTGHGLFTPYFIDPPDLKETSDAKAFITLSLTFPKQDQIETLLGEPCRYRLINRSGWIGGVSATSLRRKTVRMFIEGSLLNGEPLKTIWGKIVNVTPEDAGLLGIPYQIYRFGFAFPMGVKI